jgi:hypothetical protein
MKVYVAWVVPREPDAEPSGPPWASATHTVWFSSKRGDLILDNESDAQRELDILIPMDIRAGEHHCTLELEEEGGKFAIVCRSHPPLNPNCR